MPVAARTEAEFLARFWAKVDKSGECWLWTGAATAAGYGSLTRGGQRLYAHRTSYEAAHGALPEGMCVLHRCDTPACVRPGHLFAGTKMDNNRDCAGKVRGNGRLGSATMKLTPDAVRAIRETYAAGGITQRQLADRYDVAQITISKIVRGLSWRCLDATA